MVKSALTDSNNAPLTNRVLKALSTHITSYKTFGENVILLLNRETETSMQLLFLKLLYMIFSTRSTSEYFYTNDLHVLLDVIIRNLADLPSDDEGMQALRHTYLRVLFPLLSNSQLRREGMQYKRTQILALLRNLSGEGSHHFAPADTTTLRLVERCRSVVWLKEDSSEEDAESYSPTGSRRGDGDGQRELAMRSLGMELPSAAASTLSVVAVAAHTEKPGVVTPSLGLRRGKNGVVG